MRDVMARFVPGALREIFESEKVKAEKAVVEMPTQASCVMRAVQSVQA